MLKSELYKGLIYAGDTPLASSILVEQTGPMQLTVKAGNFTSTGQARIIDPAESKDPSIKGKMQSLLARNLAESMPDGRRYRVWIHDKQGIPLDKNGSYTLASDRAVNIPVLVTAKTYSIELGLVGSTPTIWVEGLEPQPANYKPIHKLVYPFIVPGGTANLAGVDMNYLQVLPGFPTDTKEEWEI